MLESLHLSWWTTSRNKLYLNIARPDTKYRLVPEVVFRSRPTNLLRLKGSPPDAPGFGAFCSGPESS